MVCFICKLCTEYIFFNYDGAGERKQPLLPNRAASFTCWRWHLSLNQMYKNSLDFLSCWHTVWRNREHCSQIQHYQLLYFQQNTSAKTTFLYGSFHNLWKGNQETYQESCGLRRALTSYQMSRTRNNLRFGHWTFTCFTKGSLRSRTNWPVMQVPESCGFQCLRTIWAIY